MIGYKIKVIMLEKNSPQKKGFFKKLNFFNKESKTHSKEWF